MSFERDMEKDGVFDKLYHYLWAFNDYFKEDVARLRLSIPDTVIFDNKQPLFWYFTDQNGFIRKKKTENLLLANIFQAFSSPKGDISAYFIHKSSGNTPTKIEYFNVVTLNDFLFTNSSFPSGILQAFIYPEGENNSLLQAVFSDNVCLFSKRINPSPINNPKMDIYERVCTYDGPDYLSEEMPIKGGKLSQELTDICNRMIAHIAELSFDRIAISRIILYFKRASDHRIWFLYSTSMRLQRKSSTDKRPLPLALHSKLKVPMLQLKSPSLQKPLVLSPVLLCLSCQMPKDKNTFLELAYKFLSTKSPPFPLKDLIPSSPRIIHTSLKSNKNEPQSIKTDQEMIPGLVRRLYPSLNAHEYQSLNRQLLFPNKTVRVCEDCFLYYHQKEPLPGLKPTEIKHKNTRRIRKKVDSRLSTELYSQTTVKTIKEEAKIKKKHNFKLNLAKIGKNIEDLGSERSTGRLSSNRSRQLTDRYGNSQVMSEYFTEENAKFLKEIKRKNSPFQLFPG